VCGAIAQQLAGLYRELVDRQPFSEVARVELSAAGASGRAVRLLICQCDSDDLQLLSILRRWWVVDAEGFHGEVKWPLSKALVQQEGWEAESPFIKFATNGRRVKFGMRFGPRWYVAKEGPVGADGRFVPEQLVELFRAVE
jgi:hypothetical protein